MTSWLHRSRGELEGTAYFEFLPGLYQGECWGPTSVFLGEEAFGFVEPIFARLCPNYDHYAFTQVRRTLWREVLSELDDIVTVLGGTPSDEILADRLGFFFRDTERKFFESKTANVALLRQTLVDLTSWLRSQLKGHDVISVLGL